jgi:hypothetical protein
MLQHCAVAWQGSCARKRTSHRSGQGLCSRGCRRSSSGRLRCIVRMSRVYVGWGMSSRWVCGLSHPAGAGGCVGYVLPSTSPTHPSRCQAACRRNTRCSRPTSDSSAAHGKARQAASDPQTSCFDGLSTLSYAKLREHLSYSRDFQHAAHRATALRALAHLRTGVEAWRAELRHRTHHNIIVARAA